MPQSTEELEGSSVVQEILTEVEATSETARSEIAGAVVSPGGGGFVISTPVEPVQAVGEAPLKSSDT